MGFEQGFAQGLKAVEWVYPLIGSVLGIALFFKFISAVISREPVKNLISFSIIALLLFITFAIPQKHVVIKYWEHKNGVPYQEKKLELEGVPAGFGVIYGFAYTLHTSTLAIVRLVQNEVLTDTLLIKEMSIATQYAKLEDFFRKAFSSPILGDYFGFFYNYYVLPRVHETDGNVDALKEKLLSDMDEPLPITLSDNVPNVDFGEFKAAVGNQVWTQGFFKNSPLASWNGYDYAFLDTLIVHGQMKWVDYVMLLNMVSYYAVWSSYPAGSGDDERAEFIATLKSGWRDLSSQSFFTSILKQYQKYYAQELEKSNDALMEGNALMTVGDWTIDGIVKLFTFLINWFSKYIAIILKEMYATMYPTLLGLFSFIAALFFPIIFIISVVSLNKEQFVRATTFLFGLALADFVYYSIDTFARFVAEVMGKVDPDVLLIPNMEGIVDAIVGSSLYNSLGIDDMSRFLAIATVGVMFAIPLSFSLLSRGIDAVLTGALATYQKALKDTSTAASTTVAVGTAVAGGVVGAGAGAVAGATLGSAGGSATGTAAGTTTGAAAGSVSASATASASASSSASASTSAAIQGVRAEIQRQMMSRLGSAAGRRWNPLESRNIPAWMIYELRRQARREFYRAVSEATFGGGRPYRVRGPRGRRGRRDEHYYSQTGQTHETTRLRLSDGRIVNLERVDERTYALSDGTVISAAGPNEEWVANTKLHIPAPGGETQEIQVMLTRNTISFADGTVLRRLTPANPRPRYPYERGGINIGNEVWAYTNLNRNIDSTQIQRYLNEDNVRKIEELVRVIDALNSRRGNETS